ncbi:MAG: trigger factor [Patescibacteria group bacterium]|nr:trigger factor [Patescibacteria group bacterium]
MNINKKSLEKSQIELTVELSLEEFEPYIKKGAAKVSKEIKIEGFRHGKVPYDILKQKIGEMTILEEAVHIAINQTLEKIIKNNVPGEPVGQPQVKITKIAPNNPVEYKITLALLPKIELGDYKNLKIEKIKTKIKDQDIKKTINDLREMRVKEKAVNRDLKDNDKAIVDIQMYLDKVPIENGQGKDTEIIMGKNYIVANFDKNLLGAKKTEVKKFKLAYPKDHHMKNLAGKLVEFKVTIKEIFARELPELNDEFALSLGLKKIQELKNNIKKNLEEQKEKENHLSAERKMLDKIVSKARFGDIPEILVDHEVKTMLGELEQTITSQGGKFEDYLSSMNKTRDQLTLDLLPDALKRVKVSLLIREIGNKENIDISDDEVNRYVESLKKHYKDNEKFLEQTKNPAYKNYVANVLASKKIVDKLWEWNIIK